VGRRCRRAITRGPACSIISSALVVGHLAFAREHDQRPTLAVANGMQLGSQATFGAPDTSGNSPFLARSPPSGAPSGGLHRSSPAPVSRLSPRELRRSCRSRRAGSSAPVDEAVLDRLWRPVLGRSVASLQPVPDCKNMPLTIRRSLARGAPCNSGKWSSIQRICFSESYNRLLIATSPRAAI
jgi:hypothetical protein